MSHIFLYLDGAEEPDTVRIYSRILGEDFAQKEREEKHEAFLFSQARSSPKPHSGESQRNCSSARLAQEPAFPAYAFIRGKTSSTSKRNDVVSGNPSFFNWKDTTPRSINGLSFSLICLGVPIKALGEWICERSTLLISVPSGTHRQPPNQLLRKVAGSRPTAAQAFSLSLTKSR